MTRDAEDHFFENAIDLLCLLDFNGHFKRLNPAWERTLGFTREELMSRLFIEFVHPDDRERTLKQNVHVRGGGQALAFENRYQSARIAGRFVTTETTGTTSRTISPSTRQACSVTASVRAAWSPMSSRS